MGNLSDNAILFLKKNRDKKIVFTNGCFDILHSGHIFYLNEARKLGDLLFIGINSDASVKRLKGETRPIVSEENRKYVLENLKSVDFVEIFDEETPYNLILEVFPDVLVKGGDWDVSEIIGSDIVLSRGGEVKSLSFKEGLSSTNIIDKILESK